jgi:hypothetical protein
MVQNYNQTLKEMYKIEMAWYNVVAFTSGYWSY